MDDRTKARIERINETVDILQILEGYGFRVRAGMDREQQFSCSMHGDGRDTKPSARVYPESNSWYCWACAKSRDAIETVREKENLGFMEALSVLEKRNNLPPMPYVPMEHQASVSDALRESLTLTQTFEDDEKLVKVMLQTLTEDRDLPLDRILAFWEAFDKTLWLVKGKTPTLTSDQGRVVLQKIHRRILQAFEDYQAPT